MRRAILWAAACAAIGGCGAQPLAYHSQNEIPRGPGLLTGNEGEFVLRVGPDRDEFERWKKNAQGSPEYREFQDWREWREWKRRQGSE